MSDQRRPRPHVNGASPLPRHPATIVQRRATHPAKIGAVIVQERAAHPAKAGWSGKVLPHRATNLQVKAGPSAPDRGLPERRAVAQAMLASKEAELAPILDLVPAPVSTAYSRLVAELVRDESHHEELMTLMSYDNVFKRSAPKQLEKCLEYWERARTKDSLELAMCLYTTYFYSVVNKSLRQDDYLDGVKSQLIREVVWSTRYWLRSGFRVAEPGPIRTFRWELQSEWTKDAKVGEQLSFPGFTSTHLSLAGVNGMVADIRRGTFGDVTAAALFVFEGTCQILVPQTKYYPQETEYILPAGVDLQITDKYHLAWFLMDDKDVTIFPVYHFKLMPVAAVHDPLGVKRKMPAVDFDGPRGKSRVCMLGPDANYDLGLHTCS